jgi:GT2 family glycosyltransferase
MSRRIAVVIVNFRTPGLALGAVDALIGERPAEPGLRVIVVDGGSGDGSAERLRAGLAEPARTGWTELLACDLNGGFGWANNQAMLRLLQGSDPPDYIHLLNPDTVIEPGAVSRLADVLDAYPGCAAVGSQLLEPDGSPSGSAFVWPTIASELDRGAKLGLLGRLLGLKPFETAAPAGEVDWATGASVMLRSRALREVGLFDTGFFLYFEEVELMWRMAEAGWAIRHEPASRVAHVGGAATGVNGSRPDARRPPRPAYWYESRRRFLALTQGQAKAMIASLAWLGGHASLKARRLIGSGGQQPMVDRDARRLLQHGLAPATISPAITRWDDPPDAPPAWMATRG